MSESTDQAPSEEPSSPIEPETPPAVAHSSKTWSEYFLEFLMIFLAITMGFIAENIREQFVLKNQEKEYLVSLVRDLNNDITGLTGAEASVTRYVTSADSILILFKQADYEHTSGDIYYFGRMIALRNLWRTNDGTIQQLIYSGGLSLIKSKPVIDAIQDYINSLKRLSQLLTVEEDQNIEYRKAMSSVFSGFVLNDMIDTQTGAPATRLKSNPDLHSTSEQDINDLAVEIAIVKANRVNQLILMERLKTQAGSVIELIQNEYGLE